jgi:hypothetical protein
MESQRDLNAAMFEAVSCMKELDTQFISETAKLLRKRRQ